MGRKRKDVSIVDDDRAKKPKRTVLVKVSNMGRYETPHGILSYGNLNSCGYYRTEICGKQKMVHTLVALAFHGKPPTPEHTTVNHINLNTADNRATNLEWATMKQQIRHSYEHNPKRFDRSGISKPVEARKVGTEEWTRWFPSGQAAARWLKVDHGSIRAVVNKRGNCRTCKGYEFRYPPPSADASFKGEVWKEFRPIKSWKGKVFHVSNHGRIRSPFGIISYGTPQRNGYCNFWHLRKSYRLHSVVLELFHSAKPSPKHSVNHLDLNPKNNHISNLEWATPSEQVCHSIKNNKNRRSSSQATRKPLLIRKKGTRRWVKYNSSKEAAKVLNLTRCSISKVCIGTLHNTGGYEMKYDTSNIIDVLPGEVWKTIEVDIV